MPVDGKSKYIFVHVRGGLVWMINKMLLIVIVSLNACGMSEQGNTE